MSVSQRWAEAFVNSMGADAEEAFDALKIIIPWVKKCSGSNDGYTVFGMAAANQAGRIIKKAGEQSGDAGPVLDGVTRFITLMIEKKCFHYSDTVINDIQKLLDVKNNTVRVTLESAFPADESIDELTDAVRKRTHANQVIIENTIRPELIGGGRLKIGDEVIDASVLSQLRQMERFMGRGEVNG